MDLEEVEEDEQINDFFNKVESEGFEPSSKQGINKLSTCVSEL